METFVGILFVIGAVFVAFSVVKTMSFIFYFFVHQKKKETFFFLGLSVVLLGLLIAFCNLFYVDRGVSIIKVVYLGLIVIGYLIQKNVLPAMVNLKYFPKALVVMKNLNKRKKQLGDSVPNILLVDDNADVLNSFGDYLKKNEMNVIFARNGVDGLQKFYANDIDLMITDLFMPEMNGIELIHSVRFVDPRIPIFIMSDYTGKVTLDTLSKINNIMIFDKPCDLNLVVSEIKTRLSQYKNNVLNKRVVQKNKNGRSQSGNPRF